MKRIKNLKKKTKRIILIVMALVIVIAAACYTVFIKPKLSEEKWIYMETVAERGNLIVGVTESGTLEYGITSQLYDLDLSTESDDEDDEDEEEDDEEETIKYLEVEEVYVTTGQRITEGDKIIKFTEKSIDAVRRKLSSAKTEAEVALSEAQEEYQLSTISAQEDYNLSVKQAGNAASTYQYASQIVQNTVAEKRLEIEHLYENIEKYQSKIEDAQEDYDDALEEYEDAIAAMKEVGTSNQLVAIIFEASYLSAKSAFERAEKSLEQIYDDIENANKKIMELQQEMAVASAKSGIDILEAKNTYSETSKQGDIAQTQYTATLAELQETVDDAQEEYDLYVEKLEDFESFVGDGTIYAKGRGIVTTVDYEAGDDLITSGTIVAFATEDEMTISVDVSQEDIIAMSVGDSVEIVFTAYEDTIYEGSITSITTTNTSNNSATVSYPVEISVKGDTSALYGGMTADITFVTEEHEDVVYVSKKAIVGQDGKDYVYVLSGGDYVLQPVTTGLSNGTSIEILEGLEEGDVIYIASKVSDSDDSDKEDEENLNSEEISSDEFENDMQMNDENMPGGMNGQMPDFGNGGMSGGMPGGMMPPGGMPGMR